MRLQAAAALALPWLVAYVIAPGLPVWSATAWSIALIFAALHRTAWQAWLVPGVGVLAITPAVPAWASGLLAIAVAIVIFLRPPTPQPRRNSGWQWTVVGVLVVLVVAMTAGLMLSSRSSDETFVQAQEEAAEAWNSPLITPSESQPLVPDPDRYSAASSSPASSPSATGPVATLRFMRPGTDEQPVTQQTLFIEPGIDEVNLTRGPGHYPQTAQPGQTGNFAVAGHRTGWGSPFAALDQLLPGDVVTVTGQNRQEHQYVVRSSQIVLPDEAWVLDADPLGTGEPTLTLTTCDPPGINTHRLVVFATLADDDILALPAPN